MTDENNLNDRLDNDRIDKDIEFQFPRLAQQGYRKTSEATNQYNCVAHAMQDDKRWWEPQPTIWATENGYYWPDEAPVECELNTYIRLFELQGYVGCNSANLEPLYEKVAVYWGATGHHVARQLPTGEWTSKLGPSEDVAHTTLDCLETDGDKVAYGKVRQILKRLLK